MNDEIKKIVKQNEIIISLLGRMAFNKEEIKNIITQKKRSPEAYIEGYNFCDGNNSVSDIAKKIGVTQGTVSPILSEWETIGIIYEVEKKRGKFYKKLFTI